MSRIEVTILAPVKTSSTPTIRKNKTQLSMAARSFRRRHFSFRNFIKGLNIDAKIMAIKNGIIRFRKYLNIRYIIINIIAQ